MTRFLAKIMREEIGATAVEYGLIAALVAVAAVAALTATGSDLSNMFKTVATASVGAGSGA